MSRRALGVTVAEDPATWQEPPTGGVEEAVRAVDQRQGLGALGGADDDRLHVQLLTDPWSVWCWGFEPVRRTLEHRYPSIAFDVLVGGMFPELPGPGERDFDLERFFATVHAQTGMPAPTAAVDDHEPTSTYPACVHVHAARLVDPDREAAYIRRLRETVYLDGRDVNDLDVAADAADAVGIDPEAFREMHEMGDARREFEQRLEILDRLGLHAYPTLLFDDGERTAAVQGFQTLANVLTVAEAVSDRDHPADPAPPLEAVLEPGQRVATREVAQVLGVSTEEAYDRLLEAADEGRIERARHHQADVWRRA